MKATKVAKVAKAMPTVPDHRLTLEELEGKILVDMLTKSLPKGEPVKGQQEYGSVKLDYKGIEVTLTRDHWSPKLNWAGSLVEDLTFYETWKTFKVKNYQEAARSFPAYDDMDYYHRRLRDYVLHPYRRKNIEEELTDYDRLDALQHRVALAAHFDKVAKASPLNMDTWLAAQARKLYPWFSLRKIADATVAALNVPFTDLAVTGYYEAYTGQNHFEYQIGHVSRVPLIYKREHSWGDYTVPVLEVLKVRILDVRHNGVRLEITPGNGTWCYTISSKEGLDIALKEVSSRLEIMWLDEAPTNPVIFTPARLAAHRDKNFDTKIYRVPAGLDFGGYNIWDKLELLDLNYLSLYDTAEGNIKKEVR
jgi:hypothetical protein